MFGPTLSAQVSSFFLVGNTPAVDVLQSIPPNHNATALLLGCGDVRNVLFTVWSRPKSDTGDYDFTCCDLSAEIIGQFFILISLYLVNVEAARNILLFTLIMDAPEGADIIQIWSVYYHSLLDELSLNLLRKQAQKLATLGQSRGSWRRGPYGDALRLCDQSTFDRVVKLWRWYGLDSSQTDAFKAQQQRLRSTFDTASEEHRNKMGEFVSPGVMRSASPCSGPALRDMFLLLRDFWKTGVAFNDEQVLVGSKHRNPTFSTEHGTLIVDHCTEPLQSFHLATAYCPLEKGSSLKVTKHSVSKPAAMAAMTEFQAWTAAFRAARKRLTLRFSASNAIAFCQALQDRRAHPDDNRDSQYRDNWNFDPLELDQDEYCPAKSAPTTFDVIDSSNIADHCGSLNVLTACRSALKPGPTSTFYIELLALRDESLEVYAKRLLCGDIATVSLLLGLNPVGYWTNTTTLSPMAEIETEKAADERGTGQARIIIVWKNSSSDAMTFSPSELASFVYKMYVQMLEHESFAVQMSKTRHQPARKPVPHYTRACLALFLSNIKDRDLTEFDPFMMYFLSLVLRDRALDLGPRYFGSFVVHLQGLGLLPERFGYMIAVKRGMAWDVFENWPEMPTALYLNVRVDRLWLKSFASGTIQCELGHQLFQISLRSRTTGQVRNFPDVQIGFGDIRTSGTKYSKDYAVQIQIDPDGWSGDEPMLISALVPTNVLLEEPLESQEVIVELMPTVNAVLTASTKDGSDPFIWLRLHVTTLARDDVLVTELGPNLTGRKMLQPNPIPGASDAGATGLVSFSASFDKETTRVEKLNVHIHLRNTTGAALLASKENVTFKLVSPFVLKLLVGSTQAGYSRSIELPVPLDTSGSRTRIARTSSYVEFIADLASPTTLLQKPDCLFPMVMYDGSPVLQNLGYINVANLPTVDVKDPARLQWVVQYVSSMDSVREEAISRQNPHIRMMTPDPRLNIKRIMGRNFIDFACLLGRKKCNIFAIQLIGDSCPSSIFLVDSIRLDLASLSMVLDAAMLPSFKALSHRIRRSQWTKLWNNLVGRLPVFEVDEDTFAFWQHAGAAFAERCRNWEHLPTCEYATKGTSNLLYNKDDENMICSCGLGKFPDDFKPDAPIWKDMAKHCVRVAISPFFCVPMVEGIADVDREFRILKKRMASLEHKELGCWECNKQPLSDKKLLNCGGCGVAKYCSKQCQKKDWKEGHHKHACKGMKKL
ncbi:hypothetical protein H2200_005753 [Cladophialophora chaetospira]|uniref:MYND-type domain-containing protein n=1 Tax=Cladophialophora chaetospira TaxID=386627 RepID=A0AA38X9U4_9EURO|nr:hypothetical protein H2200_005753 [Cladophialophora chaetospira]